MPNPINRVLTGAVRDYLLEPLSSGNEEAVREELINYVKKSLHSIDDSVVMCFRGSQASLYYHCHLLLRIHRSRSRDIVGDFDFRHSRFTEGYKQIKAHLHDLGVDVSKFEEENPNRRYIRFSLTGKDHVTPEALTEILDIYVSLINDFFDENKKIHQYDIPAKPKGKSRHKEKYTQQQIYTACFNNTQKTYYDFEYNEHRAKENDVSGRFDLLGIECGESGCNLVFSELKTTLEACKGASDVKKHEGDYLKYTASAFVAERKREAVEVMKLLNILFDKPLPPQMDASKMGVKIEFIFTGEAADFGDSYVPPSGIFKYVYRG